MRTRRKMLLAGAIALAALLALLLLLQPDRDEAMQPLQTAAIVQAQPREPSKRTQPFAASPQSTASAAVAPPQFDLVRVEKEEVCEGEENLITVHAHTTDGNDAFLHYTVAGEAGAQVPVRAYVGRDGNPPPQYAVAFSKDNVATRIELPPYRVKNCRPTRILIVTMRMLPNSVGERELTATVRTLDGEPFVPAWYEWSFGDGEAGVTPGPIAVHDYSALPQKTAFSDLLVKVKAFDGNGQSVEGRLPLHIRNVAFATRLRGMATIFAEPVPRFPEAGAGGIARQRFRLWHAEDGPVQVAGATLSRFFLPPSEGGAPAAPTTVSLDHTRVLRHTEIPPGTFVEESLEYDFGAEPAVYAVTFAVQGVTASGMQARGELAVLRPPPRPTRDNSIPIQDPAMMRKIRRAMTILNQETVSQEDIWRLEREGKLE
jgi:hypothetical protein